MIVLPKSLVIWLISVFTLIVTLIFQWLTRIIVVTFMVLGTVSVIASAGYYWFVLIPYPANYPLYQIFPPSSQVPILSPRRYSHFDNGNLSDHFGCLLDCRHVVDLKVFIPNPRFVWDCNTNYFRSTDDSRRSYWGERGITKDMC